MKKVVVGLSGGVDSAVAARLLQIQGYEVHGLLLRVPHAICPEEDAKAVAAHLGISLYIADVTALFTQHVIDYFCEEYGRGATPNPCVRCNPAVKFQVMADYAKEIGAEHMATGHYAGIGERRGRGVLLRDLQSEKDQSYMLHRLPEAFLKKTLFPLFRMEKSRVRELAAEWGIPVAAKRDSQEICFVPDNCYLDFLQGQGYHFPEGDFVDGLGNRLGTHKGIGAYTVGQRKGLGIISPTPVYVSGIDSKQNLVILEGEEALFRREILCDQMFFSTPPEVEELDVTVKIRLSKQEVPGTVALLPEGRAKIVLESPVRAPSKGQFAVFYQGEEVLGGGRICE